MPLKKLNILLGLVSFVLLHIETNAQQTLSILTQNRCTFSGSVWESDLYRFQVIPKVQDWVNEILQAGNVEQNFELIQTNVENVAAVYDVESRKRYLLFSQNFIENAKTKLEVYTALAHEIGHHANLHRFYEEHRKIEEQEADVFMGYVLAKIKDIASLQQIVLQVVEISPTSYPSVISFEIRKDAIENGWERAIKALSIDASGFENDPNREAFLKAQFKFPPPPCCSPREIPKVLFKSCKKLGDIAYKLSASLENNGYLSRTYLSVPNGFALVTSIELFNNDDYTSRTDKNRFTDKPIGENYKGYLDYFIRLLYPQKAHFRTFVFIVTSNIFNTQGENISKNEAAAWCGRGTNTLPKSTINMPYTEGVNVTCLVYEFEVPQSNRKPEQKCPTVLTQTHLEKSGILSKLSQN